MAAKTSTRSRVERSLIPGSVPPPVPPPPAAPPSAAASSGSIVAERWPGWSSDWGAPAWNSWWGGRLEELTDTAWACYDLNASVLAAMPPYLVDAPASLNSDWLTNPDPTQYADWSEFAKQLFWDFQSGEAFVLATAWYATGWPSRFHVVPPWMVTADMDGNGLRRYKIGSLNVTDRILPIRYKSTVGNARGQGPLEVGRARLVAANALNRYATELAASGAIPYAVLVHGEELTAEQAENLKWQWVSNRVAAMGLPGVLSGNVELKTLSIDPEKMAWLDLTRYEEARIAVLLQIPPPLVALPSGQDSLTYTNTQDVRRQHWQVGLRTKATRVMQALSGWALPRGTTVELNRDEYVRSDPLEQAQIDQVLIGAGVMSVEEVREMRRLDNSAPTQTLSAGMLQ